MNLKIGQLKLYTIWGTEIKKTKEKQNLRVFWHINKHTNINIIGVLKGERKRKEYLKK